MQIFPHEVVIFGETPVGFTAEIGRASEVRLSTMGMSVPTVHYNGTFANANGNGGPLHVIFENFKKPMEPIRLPLIPSLPSVSDAQELRNYKTICAAIVHMLGGAVIISEHEFVNATDMKLTSYYDAERRVTIKLKEDQ